MKTTRLRVFLYIFLAERRAGSFRQDSPDFFFCSLFPNLHEERERVVTDSLQKKVKKACRKEASWFFLYGLAATTWQDAASLLQTAMVTWTHWPHNVGWWRWRHKLFDVPRLMCTPRLDCVHGDAGKLVLKGFCPFPTRNLNPCRFQDSSQWRLGDEIGEETAE